MILIIITVALIIIGAILFFLNKNKAQRLLFEPIFNVDMSQNEYDLLERINNYRKENGLKEVKTEYLHTLVAKKRIEYCQLRGRVTHNLFFTHNKNLTVRRIKSSENLAQNYILPQGAFKAWVNSEPHNLNLLDPKWRFCGIAIENSMYCLILGRLT